MTLSQTFIYILYFDIYFIQHILKLSTLYMCFGSKYFRYISFAMHLREDGHKCCRNM